MYNFLFQLPKQDLSLKYCQHVSTKDQVTNLPLSSVCRKFGKSYSAVFTFLSHGMPVLLACPQVMSFWVS